MANSKQYYIRRGDQDHGPFAREQLLALGKEDKIEIDDLIVHNSTAARADTVKGLFPCKFARRQGKYLILPESASLPDVCIYSGDKSNVQRRETEIKTKFYHPGWPGYVALAITFGSCITFPIFLMILYRIHQEDLSQRDAVVLDVPKSRSYTGSKYMKFMIIFFSLCLLEFAIAAIVFFIRSPYVTLGSFIIPVTFGVMIIAVVTFRFHKHTRVYLVLANKHCVVISGAATEFLDMLMPISDLEAKQLFDKEELPLQKR